MVPFASMRNLVEQCRLYHLNQDVKINVLESLRMIRSIGQPLSMLTTLPITERTFKIKEWVIILHQLSQYDSQEKCFLIFLILPALMLKQYFLEIGTSIQEKQTHLILEATLEIK